MSVPKGDRANIREVRMYQAYNRQVAYYNSNGVAALRPEEMLTPEARDAVRRGHLDIASYGTGSVHR